jgi:hypothetical protein
VARSGTWLSQAQGGFGWKSPQASRQSWQSLKLDQSASPTGRRPIRLLETRISERVIAPVDYLIQADESRPAIERRFGFVILDQHVSLKD